MAPRTGDNRPPTEPRRSRRVLACPDKFKGTATAAEVASAIAGGAKEAGFTAVERPLSDGGEGLVDIAGGPNCWLEVTGPSRRCVSAAWRLEDGEAVIEMSQAAGLVLAGGAGANDPLTATTRGVGELIMAALDAGARRIVVGCGGSATTDGGSGALSVMGLAERFAGVELVVACDVDAPFVEAARLFAPQKGASAEQVLVLSERLEALARQYSIELGCDVSTIAGAGAAGGLAGGLAALGATLVPGFELVAGMTHLDDLVTQADVLVTGEGQLDAGSFTGKVVGGVTGRAAGRPIACVTGCADDEGRRLAAHLGLVVLDLTELFGADEAMAQPQQLISRAVTEWLGSIPGSGVGQSDAQRFEV